MKNYFYKCSSCSKEFSADEIESSLIYLCPKCGSSEKNMPLKGVLLIEYNYKSISDNKSKADFLKLTPGKFWEYPELWPINFDRIDSNSLEKLVMPNQQISHFNVFGNSVLVQDETRNPTLSYKDRASSLVALKAIELGIDKIAAASTGNAGSSLAGICARLGLKSIIYVPKNIPEAKRIQIEAYGSELVIADGDYDLAFDNCLEDSKTNKWYNRNTAYNPLTIEGKKSAAFDIFISTKGILPDNIFVPVGDGVIIAGLFKGFNELKKLGWISKSPKLIAVQSSNSPAVVNFLKNDLFVYESANTIADSISAGAPRNLYLAAKAVKETDGFGILIDDDEILKAQKSFIKQTGILCEPSSATTYAAYNKAMEQSLITISETSLLLITGNGLKDIESLKN